MQGGFCDFCFCWCCLSLFFFFFCLFKSMIWSWNILLAHRKVCGHLWIHINMHFNKPMIFDVYFACLFIFVYLILIYGSLLPPALSSYQDLLILLFHFRCCLLLFPSSCFLTKIKALWGEKNIPAGRTSSYVWLLTENDLL